MADDSIGIQEIDTGANACSVEWCPIAGLESYVACSTYLLQPESAGDGTAGTEPAVEGEGEEKEVNVGAGKGQTRSGSIVVHKVGVFAALSQEAQKP